ncbi:PAS domain S-box-containing protein [Palleronia aestuarii]|uniref:histidine kinase n=1 Tax=Palleronia aestuarii TaxID=568105 RepID=A0A2W7MPP2_9RHOB|nr:GAF domain-containing protein [Palleronia aestuarii]PZX09960.1 PAS domain S-box-containing protein [Palleronia aestuarii]
MSMTHANVESTLADPLSEEARLEALRDLGLMDRGAEEAFDRAVRIASRALGTPVSLLTFVDDRRQVFKAQVGLVGPHADAGETPLTHSFCQHVVVSGEALRVTDAREHPLVCGNPAIRDLEVIAYLGVPVRAPGGHVLGSLCAIQDSPRDWVDGDLVLLRDIAGGIETEIALRIETAERQRIREALEASHARLSHVLESTSDGIVSLDEEWRVIYVNSHFARLTDTPGDPQGRALWEIFPEAVGNAFWRDYHAAVDDQEPKRIEGYYPPLDRWFEANATPSPDGLTIFFRDITARHKAEEARKLMIRELHHRIKNLFSIVSGLISMTARMETTPGSMARALRQRLTSLAQAHDLIRPVEGIESGDHPAITLPKLLGTLLDPHMHGNSTRLSLDGPSLEIGPNSATNFALLIQEMATNAAKYGALSTPEGRLSITWSSDRDTFHLAWRESGGPLLLSPPERKGFGTQLINLSVCVQMMGRVDYEWNRSGLGITMDIPKESLAQ